MVEFSYRGVPAQTKALFKPSVAGELDMRECNIRRASLLNIPRVNPDSAVRGSDTAILVCFGPSLEDTVHRIKEFEGDVWTVSGANAYLTKRGITPRFHIECDPRGHKAELLKEGNSETVYLIASRCHPDTFQALKGRRVILFHVYDPEEANVLEELFPDDFKVPPAWTVGNMALNALLSLGYKKFIVFAMDGSFKDGKQHPEAHPNEDPQYMKFIVEKGTENEREFLSSPNHMIAAESLFRQIELFNLSIEFIGDGMIPWMYHCASQPA